MKTFCVVAASLLFIFGVSKTLANQLLGVLMNRTSATVTPYGALQFHHTWCVGESHCLAGEMVEMVSKYSLAFLINKYRRYCSKRSDFLC